MKHNLYFLIGPSASGKTTLLEKVKQQLNIKDILSCTTRKPREGEINGKDFYFISKAEFLQKEKQGDFFYRLEAFDNYYSYEFPKVFNQDYIVIGYGDKIQTYKEHLAGKVNLVFIFTMPPSQEELLERLQQRYKNDQTKIRQRLEAVKYEMQFKDGCDYTIVTKDEEQTFEKFKKIFNKNKI